VRFLPATHHVAVFWNYAEAARFRREMDERLADFGLHVAPEKTALLNFDASLLQGGTGRPVKKPDTFTFLGFTHFRTRSRKGTVHIGRTPSDKARALCRQVRRVVTNEPTRQRLGTPGAPDQGTQRLLSILWPASLPEPTRRCATAGTEALAKDVEAPKPARTPNHRLGQPARQTVVPTPPAASDTGVGLTTFRGLRPICSGEPGASIAHAGFRPGGGGVTYRPYRTHGSAVSTSCARVRDDSRPLRPVPCSTAECGSGRSGRDEYPGSVPCQRRKL